MRDRHMRQANITFLQNSSEFVSNPDNGCLASTTLLGIDTEVTDILQQPDRFQDDLTGAPDRKQVALHRLADSVNVPGDLVKKLELVEYLLHIGRETVEICFGIRSKLLLPGASLEIAQDERRSILKRLA